MNSTLNEPKVETDESIDIQTLEEVVIDRLGKNTYFHKVDVRPLWDDFYRVNVWHREIATNIVQGYRIAHSYFVQYREGAVIWSNPHIDKEYK